MIPDKEWLEIRYLADVKSRNQVILRELLDRIRHLEGHINLVDLGAGIGSNFRYLHSRIEQDQHWVFVEIDEELLNYAPDYLSTKLKTEIKFNQSFEIDNRSIFLEKQLLPSLAYLKISPHPDVIVANNSFQFYSETQFGRLIENIDADLIYFTMNYNGIVFEPESEQDRKYLDLYDRYLRGYFVGDTINMGSGTGILMSDIINQFQFDVIVGKSDWELDEDEKTLQHYILRFMEKHIPKVLPNSAEIDEFMLWVDHIQDKITSGQLSMTIRHDDILAIRNELLVSE